MKKLLVLLSMIVALVAIIPGQANALTLSQRVAKVEAKLNCLRYAGLSEWTGYAPYFGGDGLYSYDPGFEYTAASFDTAQGYPHSAGDFRVVVVKPTSICRAKFAAVTSSYLSSVSARMNQLSRLEKIGVN